MGEYDLKIGFSKKDMEDIFSDVLRDTGLKISKPAIMKVETKIKKAPATKGIKLKLPSWSEILAQKEMKSLVKDRAEILSTSYKRQVLNTILATMKQGKPLGKKGRIDAGFISSLSKNLVEGLSGYLKRGTPKNPSKLDVVANVETRVIANSAKDLYVTKLKADNKGIDVYKKWIHNPQLSIEPRDNHRKMNGVTVPIGKKFDVKTPKGKWIKMSRPHDPNAPAGEVINCHCDCDYVIVRR